jgi:hypothetical protein
VAQAAGFGETPYGCFISKGKQKKPLGKPMRNLYFYMGNLWEIYISTVMDVMAIKISYTLWL